MCMKFGRLCWLLCIHFMTFSTYVELAPGLGNIWYRIGSDGHRHVNLGSYFYFLTRPLYMCEMWTFDNWDVNYFVNLGLVLGVYVFLTQLGVVHADC